MLLYSLDGRLLSTYSAYEWSLGIKSVAWSPSSQFLAIGSYDEKVQRLHKHNLLLVSDTKITLLTFSSIVILHHRD